MHISFLTPEYPHQKITHAAGIGTSIQNLANELVKNNHKITIFVYAQDVDEEFEDEGIRIIKIAFKKYAFFGWYLYRKQLEKVMNKHISDKGIELIEAPDWTGITAFMNLKCPVLIRLHGSDTYFCNLEGRKQKWKNYWFEKVALKQADEIVSVSKFTANKTTSLFKLKKPITVIYNGVDINKFTVSDRILIEPNTLLYFGSIIRKKGVLELASIFNEIIIVNPKATLTLIGKDVFNVLEKKSTKTLFIDKLSSEAKNSVIFIEEVPYYRIQKHIAKASVVVLPSFAEAFPMTWLEAMAMGKALVTSNIGWAKELMVNGKTGFMGSPKNHKLFADKILKLLNNQQLNFEFGKNARQQIENNFSQEVISNKNIEYYKSIIETK